MLALKLVYNQLQYYIKWLGYNKDLKWYLVLNFKYSPHKLRDFYL